MRISDWSSDVCSSVLAARARDAQHLAADLVGAGGEFVVADAGLGDERGTRLALDDETALMIAVEAQQFALFDRGQLDRRVAAGVGEIAVIPGGFGGGFGLGLLVFGPVLARTGRGPEQAAEGRPQR